MTWEMIGIVGTCVVCLAAGALSGVQMQFTWPSLAGKLPWNKN